LPLQPAIGDCAAEKAWLQSSGNLSQQVVRFSRVKHFHLERPEVFGDPGFHEKDYRSPSSGGCHFHPAFGLGA
jgi:hypothetical protein